MIIDIAVDFGEIFRDACRFQIVFGPGGRSHEIGPTTHTRRNHSGMNVDFRIFRDNAREILID